MTDEKIYMIGYGTFMADALSSIAEGREVTTWGNPIDFLGPVKIDGYWRIGKRSYPIVFPDKNHSFVGILFQIEKKQLPTFDRIEGVPHLYTRQEIKTKWNGKKIKAFIYVPSDETKKGFMSIYTGKFYNREEPGYDDWLESMRNFLDPKALALYPWIFNEVAKPKRTFWQKLKYWFWPSYKNS